MTDIWPCNTCGERMIGWEDIFDDESQSEGWVWCPVCAPHDNVSRTYEVFLREKEGIRKAEGERR